MIDRIRQFFEAHLSPDSTRGDTQEHRLRLACAALLIEVSRADYEVTAGDFPGGSQDLWLAEEEVEGATSYHE